MAIESSEFSYLPAQASALGVALPTVARVTHTLPSGRIVSALRFGTDAPEIALLHGAGLNAHTWDTIALALQRPLLAIDLAGHGDSSWRDDLDYSPRTLAEEVVSALDAWTDQPQLIVGQSLGGLTGAAIAANRPDLVSALVIVDITPGIDLSAGPTALREFYAGPTDFATRDELVDRAMALGFGSDRESTQRGVFLNTRVRPDGRVEWKHHFAHLAAQTLAPQPPVTKAPAAPWEDFVNAKAPTTLVRASAGFVSEADATDFKKRIPNAHVTVMDASHNVQETAPLQLAALISEIAREL